MFGALDLVGTSIATAMRGEAQAPGIVWRAQSGRSSGDTIGMQDGAVLMPTGAAPPRRNQKQFLREYSNMPWLRAISSRVAFDVAITSWHIYGVKGGPGQRFIRPRAIQRAAANVRRALMARALTQGNLVEIEEHPLLDLINDPCPMMEGVSARKVTQEWVDITGAGRWILERDGLGLPVHAWPLPPHWIQEYPTAQRDTYIVSLPGGLGEVRSEDMLSFVDVDPNEPYSGRGSGIFYAVADELEIDEYAAKHAKGVFHNRARPDLIVTVEGADRTELNRYKRDWMGELRGVVNNWLPKFVSRRVDVKEISQSFQSLDFNNLRDHERDTIMQVIGMPPEVLGVIDNSNRATIEAADYLYASHVLVPRLELMRAVIQERLAPLFDERIIVEYDSPVADDKEYDLKVAQAAPWSRTVADWRRMGGEELEIPEDGSLDVYMIPFTLAAVRNPGDGVPAKPVAPTALPGDAQPSTQTDEPLASGAAYRPLRLLGAPVVTRDAIDPRVAALLRMADSIGDLMTAEYEGTVAAHVDRIDEAALIGALTSQAIDAAVEVTDPDGLSRALWGPRYGASPFEAQDGELLRLLSNALTGGGEMAAEQLVAAGIAIVFDTANPYATSWATGHAADLVRQVSAGQRATIRAIIEAGIENRETPYDIARQVRAVVGLTDRQAASVQAFRRSLISEGLSSSQVEERMGAYAARVLRQRAENIGRTESLSAANNGQRLLWEQGVSEGVLGPAQEREWLTAEDDRVEEECRSMDHRKAIVGTNFESPWGSIASPPGHPRCRCCVVLVVG